MFSGYLQAGAYKGLDGTLGREGWRASLPTLTFVLVLQNIVADFVTVALYRMRRHLPSNRISWLLLHP